MEIDQTNERILRELSNDGRISNAELADRVNLSASACLRRVQELERVGVIKGYRAIIDPEAVGRSFIAYIAVGLSDHSKSSQQGFERAMALAPQVRECHNITGTIEYMLRIEVRDIAAYKLFHTETLGTVANVNRIISYIVLESPKNERA